MTADARLREAFLAATSAVPDQPCPSPDVLWHAARGDLAPGAMGDVLDHVAACGPCTDDFRLAREAARDAPAARPSSPWERLLAPLASPIFAVASVVLAGVCLALLLRDRPAPIVVTSPPRAEAPVAPAPAAEVAPIGSFVAELRLTGDVVLRGGAAAPDAVTIPRGPVLLRLLPDVEAAHLGHGDLLRVRVSSAGAVLWEGERTGRQLAADGSLPLLVDASSRAPGDVVTVTVDHGAERVLTQTLRVAAR